MKEKMYIIEYKQDNNEDLHSFVEKIVRAFSNKEKFYDEYSRVIKFVRKGIIWNLRVYEATFREITTIDQIIESRKNE
jgi:hypothetical protein